MNDRLAQRSPVGSPAAVLVSVSAYINETARTSPPDPSLQSYSALDWLVRSFTPPWLRAAHLAPYADLLTVAMPISDLQSLQRVEPALRLCLAAATEAQPRLSPKAEARIVPAAWTYARDTAEAAGWYAARETARKHAADGLGSMLRLVGDASWAAIWATSLLQHAQA